VVAGDSNLSTTSRSFSKQTLAFTRKLPGKQIDIQTNKHSIPYPSRVQKIKTQAKLEHLLVSFSLFELSTMANNANYISVGGFCDSAFQLCAVPRTFLQEFL
jgi:hypothetical protein